MTQCGGVHTCGGCPESGSGGGGKGDKAGEKPGGKPEGKGGKGA